MMAERAARVGTKGCWDRGRQLEKMQLGFVVWAEHDKLRKCGERGLFEFFTTALKLTTNVAVA